jgi:15-cis-phytoene synthase
MNAITSHEFYCRNKVATRGTDLYYSLLWTTPSEQQAIIALHAFSREIQDIPYQCSEQSVARQKLAWWRIEIERLKNHQPTHPVSQTLMNILKQYALPATPFANLIDTVDISLGHTAYADSKALDRYYQALQQVEDLMALIGNVDIEIIKYLNTSRFIVNHIVNLRYHLQKQRYPFPQDNWQMANGNLADLHAYKMHEPLRLVLQQEALRARDYYQQALTLISEINVKRLLPALIQAKLALSLLNEIEKDNFNVLDRHIRLTPLRKLWIAWRTRQTIAKPLTPS